MIETRDSNQRMRKHQFSQGKIQQLIEEVAAYKDVLFSKARGNLCNREKEEEIIARMDGCSDQWRSDSEVQKMWQDFSTITKKKCAWWDSRPSELMEQALHSRETVGASYAAWDCLKGYTCVLGNIYPNLPLQCISLPPPVIAHLQGPHTHTDPSLPEAQPILVSAVKYHLHWKGWRCSLRMKSSYSREWRGTTRCWSCSRRPRRLMISPLCNLTFSIVDFQDGTRGLPPLAKQHSSHQFGFLDAVVSNAMSNCRIPWITAIAINQPPTHMGEHRRHSKYSGKNREIIVHLEISVRDNYFQWTVESDSRMIRGPNAAHSC